MVLLLLVLPAVSLRGWITPTPVQCQGTLGLATPQIGPRDLFYIPFPKGRFVSSRPSATASFWERQEAGSRPWREQPDPFLEALRMPEEPGGGIGHPPPASPPGFSPPNRARGESLSRGQPTLANSGHWMRRRRQMRQNEKYNDAYYINHPPVF